MEDILASIRRILSEDETPQVASPSEDVLVLDRTMMVAEGTAQHPAIEPAVAPPTPEPPSPPVLVQVPVPEPPPPVTMQVVPESPIMSPVQADDKLVSDDTVSAASGAMSGLMRALAADSAARISAAGPTIEDLVRAELRPMLKTWLDTHLPLMVERLVAAEIDRVVAKATR